MFTLDKIPKRCCGPAIIGASILGGAGLIGTGASIFTNESNQSYGAEQSEASRAWGTNERIATQEYNTKERLATQEYNNPANQAMMLRAGGLNPSAISQGVRFVGSAPQSSSPGSAGGISPMGTKIVPNIPQLISSGSDLVNALAKHKETEASLPLIGEEVKYYVQKTYGEQLSNDLMKIEKEFKQSTLPASIKKVHEEVAKLEFEKLATEKQGKVFDQEAKLKDAQSRLTNMQEKLTGEQAIQSHYLTDNWHRITDSMLQLQKSQTSANYAQANASNASAYKQYAEGDFQKMVNSLKSGTLDEEMRSMLDTYSRQSQENKAKTEEFKDMFNRYKTLNENNENAAADYLNHLMWYVKEKMPSLPIVPFLKIGK